MTSEERRGPLLAMLTENPETVISIHVLTRGDCNIYMSDNQRPRTAAIVQPKELPSEPIAFGSEPNAIWQELTQVKGWQCILVGKEVALPLGEIISSQLKTPVSFLDDVYHIAREQVMSFEDKSVRRMTIEDITQLETLSHDAQPIGFWGDLRTSLTEGLVAGAIVEGKVVGTCFAAARGQRYVDIGVNVLENYRRRGLATTTASLVTRSVQSEGLIPVWSCGSHNLPSLRLARKLGFAEVSRRTYVIIQEYLADVLSRTYPVRSERECEAVE
jgi:RimJ/RimL family protein N-acetyltransferase